MKCLNKKADGGLTAVVIVVIVLIFVGWLVSLGQRECRTNNDCGSEQYCGSDFSCHQIPVIEKSSTTVEYDLTGPAFIIGLAIVIAAVILKWDKINLGKLKIKRKKEKETSQGDYIYYTGHKD